MATPHLNTLTKNFTECGFCADGCLVSATSLERSETVGLVLAAVTFVPASKVLTTGLSIIKIEVFFAAESKLFKVA